MRWMLLAIIILVPLNALPQIPDASYTCKQVCDANARSRIMGCGVGCTGPDCSTHKYNCEQAARVENDACQARCDGVIDSSQRPFVGIPAKKKPKNGFTPGSGRGPTQKPVQQPRGSGPIPYRSPGPIPYPGRDANRGVEDSQRTFLLPGLQPYSPPSYCASGSEAITCESTCRAAAKSANFVCFREPPGARRDSCIVPNMRSYENCKDECESVNCYITEPDVPLLFVPRGDDER